MHRSIRWRLQVWYALVLLAAVGGFAGLLYTEARAARLHEVDANLEAAVLYLDVNLRRLTATPDAPTPELRRIAPGGKTPAAGPELEQLLDELRLPTPTEPDAADPSAVENYFAIWRADGSLLKSAGRPEEAPPPTVVRLFKTPDQPEAPASGTVGLRRPQFSDHGEYREAAMLGPQNMIILVGHSLRRDYAGLRKFAWQLAGAASLALAVGLIGGWVVSSRILRPVAAIGATASRISATNLSGRINPDAVDRELVELAHVLNAMFERLEAAFDRQARFTADASHELRTPLAIIRSHAELALARPREAEDYRETIETCLKASKRMAALVDGLLTLARADAGKLELRHEPVDLSHLVEETVDLFRPLAERKKLRLAADLDPAIVTGDPLRLQQVVTNLLSNAVQYNRPGGVIRVALTTAGAATMLAVTDTGCGIPEEDRPFLFERFYRVDKARSRAAGGNGLGLAICKSIVEAHRGAIDFDSKVDTGSTFRVRLPLAEEPRRAG